MILALSFWAWSCTSSKNTLLNAAFKFNSGFLVLLGSDYHCNFVATLFYYNFIAYLFLHPCNFDRRLKNLYRHADICEIKNTNVFKQIFLIRKTATQNTFCILFLLCFWKCLDNIAALLAGLSKHFSGRYHFS